ncbi:MAG TPA: glycosyltransferase [Pyrinomonadaceae bacterium]
MKHGVLILVDSFNQGGSERQAVQLARLLTESGRFRVHMASIHAEGVLRAEAERLEMGEIPSYPLTSFYDRNYLTQLRRLARDLRRLNISILHTNDFYTNIFGMTAAAVARTPVRIASRRESAVRSRAQRFVERSAYRLAHAVIANCEEVRRQLVRIEGLPAAKAVTLYNGLDMQRLTPRAGLSRDEMLALFGLPTDERRRFVTIVANLRLDLKDHPTFLRAARRVRERVPDAAFVLAGEGGLTGGLKALARELGLERDTFFIGHCAHVPELLAVSDVCVLSSRSEGFSNSILEYMAAARPVVATDVGGAREAILEGETGHLVSVGDDEALAARIISLLEEPERARRMGEQGRRRILENFSCEAQLERTEKLYERLLASRGRSMSGQPRREQVRFDDGAAREERVSR